MIIANFIPGYDEITSDKLTQWDYGRQLHIYGLEDLPEIIEVHFCDRTCEKALIRIANKVDTHFEVAIPDRLLENEYSINAFIYLNATTNGQTVKTIHIPVIKRKQPENYVDPGDPTVDDKLTELMEHVAALDTKFARVFGTNDEGLDIQICDEIPPEENQKPNVLYIAPDDFMEKVAEMQTAIQGLNRSIFDLSRSINTVRDNSLSLIYNEIRLADSIHGLINPEGGGVDITGKLNRDVIYLIRYKEQIGKLGTATAPYELHTAIFYYQYPPTYEEGFPERMYHRQWIDRRTYTDSNGGSVECGLYIYSSDLVGQQLCYKRLGNLETSYIYDVIATPLTKFKGVI